VVRVPIRAAREQYLMVIEGGLPVAFAWPAVIHIVMAGAGELGSGLPAPRVPALTAGIDPASGGDAEFPVILLGHGLKRGYYVAERLVWRLPATVIETVSPPPVAGLTHAVQTDEGDCYWVADPAWLLDSVAEPSLEVPPAPPWTPPPVRALDPADVAPIELSFDEVVPLGMLEPPPSDAARAAEAREAAPPAPPSAAPTTAPAPSAPATGFRAALVAEDSITASIFLARLLEQQGYLVRTVDSAVDLARELARGDWALVCVDVELPDGRGRDYLRAVREAHEHAHARHPGPATLVALVRDPDDLADAQAAGIPRVLRKPVTREALELLLRRVDSGAGGAS
jgi:CheY-like chemotaxis protein